MAEHFISLLGPLPLFNVISGVCIPGLPSSYRNFRKVAVAYWFVVQLVCISQSVGCVIVLIDYKHASNAVHVVSILILYLGSSFWSICFLLKENRLKELIKRIDKIIEVFNNQFLSTNRTFVDDLKIKFKFVKTIIIVIFMSFTVLPITNNAQKLIRNWKYFGSDGVKTFNYQPAYDASTSPVYEVTILLQCVSLFWACTAQCGSLHFFSTFYFLLSNLFQHLQTTINGTLLWHNVSAENKTNNAENFSLKSKYVHELRNSKKADSFVSPTDGEATNGQHSVLLKQWIAIHQEMLSISKDLIELYSPLLAVYFIYLYICIAFTVLSAVENAHSHTAVELMVLAYFSFLTLMNFYMVCSCGHYLMVESEKLGWAIYFAPWYSSSRQHKTLAKVILARVSRPLVVKCYSSNSFDLTNATFIVMLKSIVSFYFGLVQMKNQ